MNGNELCSLVFENSDTISSRLLNRKKISSISEVRSDAGDRHNCGKRTAIITTNAGKIVFKPHDLSVDEKYRVFINKFFPDITYAPKAVNCGSYGFCEYIENAPSSGREGASVYYRNLGSLLVVFQILGTSDLHHSNVLAKDDRPVLIDIETLMRAAFYKRAMNIDKVMNDIFHSLCGSGLFPHGNDNCQLSFMFDTSEKNVSMPVKDGVKQTADVYLEDILAGYNETYDYCLRIRDELKEAINDFSNCFFRHIVRPTSKYMILLRETENPDMSADEKEKHFFQIIHQPFNSCINKENNDSKTVHSVEAKAMARGDIPYFYSRGSDHDLYAEGEIIAENYFDFSAVENAMSRIDFLGENDRRFETDILKCTMSRIITTKQTGTPVRYIQDTDSGIDSSWLGSAEAVFEALCSDMIMSASSFPLWMGMNEKWTSASNIMGYGLFDGYMGLASFFAAFGSAANEKSLFEKAEGLCIKLIEQLKMTFGVLREYSYGNKVPMNLSFSSGLAGALFSLDKIAEYLPSAEGKAVALCQEMINYISAIPLDRYKDDLTAGTAGLLKTLCRSERLYSMQESDATINTITDILLKRRTFDMNGISLWDSGISNGKALSGMGHGQAGIASALRCAYRKTGRNDVIEAVTDAMHYEQKLFSESLCGWPDYRKDVKNGGTMHGYCSGAPGIGIDAIDIIEDTSDGYPLPDEILKTARVNLENAKKSCLERKLTYKDHLCCGKMALCEFMLRAGNMKDAEDAPIFRNKGEEILKEVISRGRREGYFHFQRDDVRPYLNCSLYYGIAGVGYEALRYAYPDRIKSVLL